MYTIAFDREFCNTSLSVFPDLLTVKQVVISIRKVKEVLGAFVMCEVQGSVHLSDVRWMAWLMVWVDIWFSHSTPWLWAVKAVSEYWVTYGYFLFILRFRFSAGIYDFFFSFFLASQNCDAFSVDQLHDLPNPPTYEQRDKGLGLANKHQRPIYLYTLLARHCWEWLTPVWGLITVTKAVDKGTTVHNRAQNIFHTTLSKNILRINSPWAQVGFVNPLLRVSFPMRDQFDSFKVWIRP